MRSALLFLVLGWSWHPGGEPLKLPEPVQFPEFIDSVQVSGALVKALTEHKWVVEKDTGESVTAYRENRGRRLRVRLDYDNHTLSYHYLESVNFDGEDDPKTGEIRIHKRANAWLRELGDMVRIEMQPLVFAHDPATVVPVTPAQ